jgi:hypothetical protein
LRPRYVKDQGLQYEVSPSVDMFPNQKLKAVEEILRLSISKVPAMMLAQEFHSSDAKGKHALFLRRLREDNPENKNENPADEDAKETDSQSSDHERTFSIVDWQQHAFAGKATPPTWQLCCQLLL